MYTVKASDKRETSYKNYEYDDEKRKERKMDRKRRDARKQRKQLWDGLE